MGKSLSSCSCKSLALSVTHDVTMNQADVVVPPAGQYHIQKKKRTASAETIAKLEEAEEMRELALIFNTTKGLKGGYGGLGLDVNQAQERTIDEIIDATTPSVPYGGRVGSPSPSPAASEKGKVRGDGNVVRGVGGAGQPAVFASQLCEAGQWAHGRHA